MNANHLKAISTRLGAELERIHVNTLPAQGSPRALGKAQACCAILSLQEGAEAIEAGVDILAQLRRAGVATRRTIAPLASELSDEIDRLRFPSRRTPGADADLTQTFSVDGCVVRLTRPGLRVEWTWTPADLHRAVHFLRGPSTNARTTLPGGMVITRHTLPDGSPGRCLRVGHQPIYLSRSEAERLIAGPDPLAQGFDCSFPARPGQEV